MSTPTKYLPMQPADPVQLVVALKGGATVLCGPMPRELANQIMRGWWNARETVARGLEDQSGPYAGYPSVAEWLEKATYAGNYPYTDGVTVGQESFAGDVFAWSEVAGMHLRDLRPCDHGGAASLQARYLELQTRLMEEELERRRREDGWRQGEAGA